MHVRHACRVTSGTAALLAALLAACGSSESTVAADFPAGPPAIAADGQGRASPATCGALRPGQTYDVTIPSPHGSGETIGATVFEPAVLTGCEKYPLVLWGSGFGSKRARTAVPTDPEVLAFFPFGPIARLLAAGYGVVSFDHLAHGDSDGIVRIQDPDYEGQAVLRVVDWAEANLDWLAYGAGPDGAPDNLRLGAVGPSYGGMYQLMLLGIDPKQRLDAIAPSVTTHDMGYSLFQGGAIKTAWAHALFDGREDQLDPFISEQLALTYAQNRPTPALLEFLRYHSPSYWCDGEPATGNGGSAAGYPPRLPQRINALFLQSSRDTLFDLGEAARSVECLQRTGGDVRLFTVQIGHNSTGLLAALGMGNSPLDPGIVYQPDPTSTGFLCGGLPSTEAIVAFFDEHLKGIEGSADRIPGPVCLSLTAIDSVTTDAVQRGGARYDVDGTDAVVTLGVDDSQNTTVLLDTILPLPRVLGGIPRLDVTLTDADDAARTSGDVILYVGIGHRRLGIGPWDLVDNQLTALRGLGRHTVEMKGTLERLMPGDQVGLMLFGANANQFPGSDVPPAATLPQRVRLQGFVELPLLD